MKISFSIIVPVYCTEQYVSRCIESILNQENAEFEIILIDDGSTDNSGTICDKYAEKYNNIKVIHKENEGVSAARNTGITVAEKSYLVFVDSDDYIKQGYLNALSMKLDRYPDICFGTKHIEVRSAFEKTVSNGGDSRCVSIRSGKRIRQYFSENDTEIPEAVCCNCYRTKFIKKNGISFSEKLIVGEDVDFMFQAFFRMKNASWIEEPYYYYYHRECDSATSSWNSKKLLSILNVYYKWFVILRNKSKNHIYYQGYLYRMADKANTNLLKGSEMSVKECAVVEQWICDKMKFLLYSKGKLKKIACISYDLCGYGNMIRLIKKMSAIKNKMRTLI